ncbi:carbohydrate kinase [Bacteroidales bacterium OttesenSCG-928-I14]|nr:carbohydrate kinase [Bacteroidales bacterium OttesenSCG-928-I14]
MNKVIGIGETILDIVFQDGQPQRAVPGGSTFNCMVSLSRVGLPVLFISELTDDRVGRLIKAFMEENNMQSDYICSYKEGSSPISLAFLDENQNASYQFYKNFPKDRLKVELPLIEADDVVVISSYFAVNPILRPKVLELISKAKNNNAIIYYDINFRKAHQAEREALMHIFEENIRYSDIIRASEEDLEVVFGLESKYDLIAKYPNKIFIITKGEKDVSLYHPCFAKDYPVKAIEAVSTIGAGDNFNAGLIYGLVSNSIKKERLLHMKESLWDEIIDLAKLFALNVCSSLDNYISLEMAEAISSKSSLDS